MGICQAPSLLAPGQPWDPPRRRALTRDIGLGSEHERGSEVAGRSVTRSQRLQPPAPLEESENRGGIVPRVAHDPALREWRDEDGRHARSRPPAIDTGLAHVVPPAPLPARA